MDLSVLGTLSVRDGGRPLVLGGQKQRAVLAMLALESNTTVSVDRLAEGVWGELVPDRYVQNLQVYVSTLRRILEPRRTTTMPSRIVARGAGYELVVADDELDLARFRRHAADGTLALDAAQPATAAMALRAALLEWRSEPCGDLVDLPFHAPVSRSLNEEWWIAFERCMDAELANGRGGELVAELEQALARSPLREKTWEHLVVALYRAGRQADALRACSRARAVLVEELGIDPGPRLRTLEREVLEQSSALDSPPRAAVREARLPVPLTSLIGREALVEDVDRLLEQHRVVVLTGHGGVGKTRIALAVAAQAHAAGRTVFFADITPERDATRVTAALARSAGLSDAATAGDVADTVERSAALLVVDNFEQVVDAADAIATVAALAPSGRVLVTSRVRLGIPGEHVVDVEPLSADAIDGPAPQLFWDRALAVDPRLQSERHSDAVLAICQALDGMPLAIELVASRVTTFDPTALADQIATAVETVVDLGTGRRRHGSLRAAIRWSTELLTAEELSLFGVLAVCESTADLETVVAVASAAGLAPSAAQRALDGLVRASLIRTVETPAGRRYGYLATTRAVARESADEILEHRVRQVHGTWFADRAWRQVHAPDDAWLACAVADLPDSAAALAWLADHDEPARTTALLGGLFGVALVTADRYRYVRSLASRLIEAQSLPTAFAARASIVAGGMAYIEGDIEAAARLLASASDLADDDHFFQARAAMWLAAVSAEVGDHDESRRLAEVARERAALVGVARLVGASWSVSGYVALTAGDPAWALACAEERLKVEPSGGLGEANATVEVGYALVGLDRIEEASEQVRLGLVRAQRLGFAQAQGDAYRCMAWCALLRRDPGTAAACLLRQLAIFGGHDAMTDRLAETPLTAAVTLALAGQVDRAIVLWASGQHLIARLHLSTQDLPLGILALADELGLVGGRPLGDDLASVLPTVVAMLEAVSTEMAEQ